MDPGSGPVAFAEERAQVRASDPANKLVVRLEHDALTDSFTRPFPAADRHFPLSARRDCANGYIIAEICSRYFPVRPRPRPFVPRPTPLAQDNYVRPPSGSLTRASPSPSYLRRPRSACTRTPTGQHKVKENNWTLISRFFVRTMPRSPWTRRH